MGQITIQHNRHFLNKLITLANSGLAALEKVESMQAQGDDKVTFNQGRKVLEAWDAAIDSIGDGTEDISSHLLDSEAVMDEKDQNYWDDEFDSLEDEDRVVSESERPSDDEDEDDEDDEDDDDEEEPDPAPAAVASPSKRR